MPGKLPILMTASISTHGMKGAMYSDSEREAMYLSTIKHYIDHILNRENDRMIVFAENSGFDMTPIIEQIRDYSPLIGNIEFISLDPSDFDITKGKGYNEAILIDQAIDRSPSIKACGAFFKVTGRYPILNLQRFLSAADSSIASGCQLYADIKDHNLYRRLGLDWKSQSFESRLYGMTTGFWRNTVMPGASTINEYDDYHIEDYLFERCRHTEHRASLRFKREPKFGGLPGHAAQTLAGASHTGPRALIKRLVGNTIRILLPGFWF